MMRINGFIPISKLNGKCATCKNFNQLIKELYGIKTLTARSLYESAMQYIYSNKLNIGIVERQMEPTRKGV